MSDVGLARAPRWAQWLSVCFVFIVGNRPVIMTAARRDRLQNDADALPLAMEVIEELRASNPTGVIRLDQGGEAR